MVSVPPEITFECSSRRRGSDHTIKALDKDIFWSMIRVCTSVRHRALQEDGTEDGCDCLPSGTSPRTAIAIGLVCNVNGTRP